MITGKERLFIKTQRGMQKGKVKRGRGVILRGMIKAVRPSPLKLAELNCMYQRGTSKLISKGFKNAVG